MAQHFNGDVWKCIEQPSREIVRRRDDARCGFEKTPHSIPPLFLRQPPIVSGQWFIGLYPASKAQVITLRQWKVIVQGNVQRHAECNVKS